MKQFLRNFRKQKVAGILNICSLSLGIMVSIVVGLWAIGELSFDNFHRDVDNMYKLAQVIEFNGETINAAASFKPTGELAQREIPEIADMCRVVHDINGVAIRGMVNPGVHTIVTDHNFFDFFTFPFYEGDPASAFSGPHGVVITRSAAERYFPEEEAIGSELYHHGDRFFVTAIMEDFPRNSHIQAEMVFPLFRQFKKWEWDSSFNYETYFRLAPTTNLPAVEQRLEELAYTYGPRGMRDAVKDITLLPMKDVHFFPTGGGFDEALKGDRSLVGIFVLIAIAILVIACINFTNLFISTSFIRARTIGIKKSLGASPQQLSMEFYRETATYVFIAIIIGVLLSLYALPLFNGYTGSHIRLDFTSPAFYIFIAGLALATILLAGSFSALYLTRLQVLDSVSGRYRGRNMSFFQKSLVVVQFASALFLLIVVAFFGRQIDTLLTKELGFDNKNVIYVYGWRDFGDNFKQLREEMIREPSIADVAMKQYRLPYQFGSGIAVKNPATGDIVMMDHGEVSPNYLDFFGMEIIEGENPLYLESSGAEHYCVLNQKAVELLGLENPIDQVLTVLKDNSPTGDTPELTAIVKGVVKDSYVKSLHQFPDAQLYSNASRDRNNPLFFKIAGDPQQALAAIERKWKQTVLDAPFRYGFLDEDYRALYAPEMDSRKVLSFAFLITMVITVAGLFAMAYYSAQRRRKEIGIRKINGATVKDLMLLLNRDVSYWVAAAFVVACPVAWFFLHNWLRSFIIKTPLSAWIFIVAGILVFAVALLTVSYQTWKAATDNPVNSLKNE